MTAFENTVGKEEIARNVFYSIRKLYPPFVHIFDIIYLFAAELEEPKIGIWVKGSNVEIIQIKINIFFRWLVVLGFNATLTANVISWWSVTHMCFLAFSH